MKNYLTFVKWIFLMLLLWAGHVTSSRSSHVNTESGETHSVDDILVSSSSLNSETSNNCDERVHRGECETNSDFMVSHCASECIHSSFATTISLDPKALSSDGHDNGHGNDNGDGTHKNENEWNKNAIQVEIGVQQIIHPDHSQDSNMIKATLENILKTNSYMQSFLPKAAQKFSNYNLGGVNDVEGLVGNEENKEYLEEDGDEEEGEEEEEEKEEEDDDEEDDDEEEKHEDDYNEEQEKDDDDDDENHNEEEDEEIELGEKKDRSWHDLCVNEDPHCHSLAASGKCLPPENYNEDDPDVEDPATMMYEFMMEHCAPACQTCDDLLEYEEGVLQDCNFGPSTNIFQPGDLDRMFERILEEAKNGTIPFTVNILSRPTDSSSNDTTPNIETEKNETIPFHHNGPWIITIDNFLTDEECDRLIELGGIEEYEVSGLAEEDEMTEEEWQEALKEEDRPRTSTNAWCQYECYEDPIAKQVISKIEKLTGIPDNYQEWLQLVKYTPGQFYKSHHDNGKETMSSPEGPRLLTVFMYLNDVEEGGATRFNDILGDDTMVQMDVIPRKGTALIWPSVLSDFPNDEIDERTYHEAMVVTKGVKYGANAWLHLRDYKNSIGNCDPEEFERVLKKRGIFV